MSRGHTSGLRIAIVTFERGSQYVETYAVCHAFFAVPSVPHPQLNTALGLPIEGSNRFRCDYRIAQRKKCDSGANAQSCCGCRSTRPFNARGATRVRATLLHQPHTRFQSIAPKVSHQARHRKW